MLRDTQTQPILIGGFLVLMHSPSVNREDVGDVPVVKPESGGVDEHGPVVGVAVEVRRQFVDRTRGGSGGKGRNQD